MNTMKWLIKREAWENKGLMLWAPLFIGGIMILFTLIMLLAGNNATIHLGPFGTMNEAVSSIEAEQREQIAAITAAVYPVIATPIYLILGILVFFYCLGALYDDRRDRSILFWKSLPVSDTMTVLSKAFMAMIVLPSVVVAIACATSLILLFMVYLGLAFKGLNLIGPLLASPAFWLSPLRVITLVPLYMLWALPTVGWLLMVSSWSRTRPFLWAVVAPLVTGGILAWAHKIFSFGPSPEWLFGNVIGRMLGSVLPGAWFLFDEAAHAGMQHSAGPKNNPLGAVSDFYIQSWSTLGGSTVWIGAIAGVAMIGVAIWMRRWREEG